MSNITYKYIKQNPDIQTYVSRADDALNAIGYTEHSNAHVERAADVAYMILKTLNYPERECELAQIAAYMHDIGNIINRVDHAHSGAIMAFRLLDKLDMPPSEIAVIISAIGNHDEATAMPINAVTAALILADKTDIRRTRVRKAMGEFSMNDIHDRVNYAVESSDFYFSEDKKSMIMQFAIDLDISSVTEFFEIFLNRMALCRNAASFFGVKFELIINGSRIL